MPRRSITPDHAGLALSYTAPHYGNPRESGVFGRLRRVTGCNLCHPCIADAAKRGGTGPPRVHYIPSTLLLTRMLTATRRFWALPSGVELSASGSAEAMPVGESMRHGFQPQACCR